MAERRKKAERGSFCLLAEPVEHQKPWSGELESCREPGQRGFDQLRYVDAAMRERAGGRASLLAVMKRALAGLAMASLSSNAKKHLVP